jgi:hypothetical protein
MDAQKKADKTVYTEASELTIVGKVFPNTPDPYKRMDFTKYHGWTERDTELLNMSSGIIASFCTDAPSIKICSIVERREGRSVGNFSFDLYIKKDGEWLWAACKTIPKGEGEQKEVTMIEHMTPDMKECLVWFPNFSAVESVKIGIPKGYKIKAGEKPYKYDIVLHGSSFTHGHGSSRPATTLPGFLTRMTGFQFNSLAVSGDCRMQPQFQNALKDAKADAFVFDTFSNPNAEEIAQRTFGFIETIQSTHPGVPLIFISTIYRERRNFDTKIAAREEAKVAAADSVMALAVKKYKDVYYVRSNATSPDHETSVDGTHPGDWGYHLWAESIVGPIKEILAKYGME